MAALSKSSHICPEKKTLLLSNPKSQYNAKLEVSKLMINPVTVDERGYSTNETRSITNFVIRSESLLKVTPNLKK